MKRTSILLSLLGLCMMARAENARETILLDSDWQFAFGNAQSPALDFGCGTEYFNYLTKAASIHNEGPYSPKFDASKWPAQWKTVDLPHDWVVDLPFAPEASHSHGYKTVGYKYPQTSIGWYRKTFRADSLDQGKHIYLRFDGIFRDARIWVNGFYLGSEPSGYATQIYDISEYINYGDDNLICVRADAQLEEGWFYEGAGIYRHVWLCKESAVAVTPFGTAINTVFGANNDFAEARVSISTTVKNNGNEASQYRLRISIADREGKTVGTCSMPSQSIRAKEQQTQEASIALSNPRLWSCDDPYLYSVRTEVFCDGDLVDASTTRTGFRSAVFDAERGFVLNGKPLKIKGVNMHQDHAGVGAALPDALQVYRLRRLKEMGCNAYRSSHNPMTPEMLDACDSLGILVMEENRLSGINDEHLRLLGRMIERDRNHPSIILWSVGNEEWGLEWNEKGERISASMRDYVHLMDPSRPMTFATSSGPTVVRPADVAGYNYVVQNPIEQHRADYPTRKAVGSEETTGCGTRGVYYDSEGVMAALNRTADVQHDSTLNRIERGWKFYAERPWLGGLFYWTGFDYRGEPNPLSFPATGSQFGILDYCGFDKDEAYYLRAWWTDQPVLHILPHWNLEGHEGEEVSIWAYSNADEVELFVNGKSQGRKAMPRNGHLEWTATYRPGVLKAVGYKGGKRVMTQEVPTTGAAQSIAAQADRQTIGADGRDVAVVTLSLTDKKGRNVPTACNKLRLSISGEANILGVGNGNSAFKGQERPTDATARTFEVEAFNGLAQVLLQSNGSEGTATLTIEADGLKSTTLTISCR